ncbi:Uu.00g136920.m01.CDS01 [Anthostomella pinea]|uniref:Uu.00g136920.m01.CDS01 n=1 Tax=Anthostomella pinea TaxID=933095 RepID=A0AAI8VQM0_9PEZI|nr:Uu.00g136920.m01.CDS01 [Anthostomella pinea]
MIALSPENQTTFDKASHISFDELITPVLEYSFSTLKIEKIISPAPVKSFKEAKSRPELWDAWKPAFNAQIDSLKTRKAFDLVYLPSGQRALPVKWVPDQKFAPNGDFLRNRARLVVCGNFEEGHNWAVHELYAAVASSMSVKVFFTLVAVQGLHCSQHDIVTAFLHAPIPQGVHIYCRQPPDYSDGTERVWKLNQALYGHRKSSVWWFEELSSKLKTIGFEPFHTDLCIFKHEKLVILLIVHVDDILIAAKAKADCDLVVHQLERFFDLKNLGEVSEFLGYRVIRNLNHNQIFLCQEKYCKKILSKYADPDVKPVTTPWLLKAKIPSKWEPIFDLKKKKYLKHTSSKNYLSSIWY